MASGQYGAVLGQVRRLLGRGTVSGLAEGQLLERFVARHDEAAFEAMVSRHGPMVLGVCRRVLADPNDVEDAFQATFLILVRKARTIRDGDLLGNWLYGVAYRVAVRARADAARRRDRETPGAEEAAVDASRDGERRELGAVLDEELSRLPEKYRAPLVLCYLQGRTHEEAAERLKWPVGTVRSRMARARGLLRGRLTRRGLALPAGLAGASVLPQVAGAAVPVALLDSTVKAAMVVATGRALAAGAFSAGVATLSEEVMHTMFVSKLKWAAGLVLGLGVAAGGAGVAAMQVGGSVPDGPDDLPRRLAQIQESLKAAQDEAKTRADEVKRLRSELEEARRLLASRQTEIAKLNVRLEKITGQATGPGPGPAGAGIGGGQGGPIGAAAGPATGFGHPPVAPRPGPAVMNFGSLIVSVSQKTRRVLVASSADPRKRKVYQAPEGVEVITPLVAQDVLALHLEGPKVTEVAVFDSYNGAWGWEPQGLREPVEGMVRPIVTSRAAVYQAGRFLYAYSGYAHKWGALELEEGALVRPALGPDGVTFSLGSKFYGFDLKSGEWGVADLDPDKPDPGDAPADRPAKEDPSRGDPGAGARQSRPGRTVADLGPANVRFWAETRRVLVTSRKSGKEAVYQAPEGIESLTPIVAPAGLVVLQVKGPKVTEIAVFAADTWTWYPQELAEPVEGTIGTMVGAGGFAIYQAGRFVYAFSVEDHKWYPLELREPAERGAGPVVHAGMAIFRTGRFVYAFSARARKWSALEFEKGAQVLSLDDGYSFSDGRKSGRFDPETGEWRVLDLDPDKPDPGDAPAGRPAKED